MSTSVLDKELRDAVERGVKLLDEVVPNWYTLIDLDILDMGNYNCVCGQLNVQLGKNPVGFNYEDSTTSAFYGFFLPWSYGHYADDEGLSRMERWGHLDEVWKEQILLRRTKS